MYNKTVTETPANQAFGQTGINKHFGLGLGHSRLVGANLLYWPVKRLSKFYCTSIWFLRSGRHISALAHTLYNVCFSLSPSPIINFPLCSTALTQAQNNTQNCTANIKHQGTSDIKHWSTLLGGTSWLGGAKIGAKIGANCCMVRYTNASKMSTGVRRYWQLCPLQVALSNGLQLIFFQSETLFYAPEACIWNHYLKMGKKDTFSFSTFTMWWCKICAPGSYLDFSHFFPLPVSTCELPCLPALFPGGGHAMTGRGRGISAPELRCTCANSKGATSARRKIHTASNWQVQTKFCTAQFLILSTLIECSAKKKKKNSTRVDRLGQWQSDVDCQIQSSPHFPHPTWRTKLRREEEVVMRRRTQLNRASPFLPSSRRWTL